MNVNNINSQKNVVQKNNSSKINSSNNVVNDTEEKTIATISELIYLVTNIINDGTNATNILHSIVHSITQDAVNVGNNGFNVTTLKDISNDFYTLVSELKSFNTDCDKLLQDSNETLNNVAPIVTDLLPQQGRNDFLQLVNGLHECIVFLENLTCSASKNGLVAK